MSRFSLGQYSAAAIIPWGKVAAKIAPTIKSTATGWRSARITAKSVVDKLDRYLLNPSHPEGAGKAKFFRETLGYTRENMHGLAKQITFDKSKVIKTQPTEWGPRYIQEIEIIGANGNRAVIKSVWQQDLNGSIRLITAMPN